MAETKVAKRSKYKYHVPVVSVRLVRENNFYSDKSISNPDDAGWLAYHFAKDFDREVFGVICLTTNGDIANISVVSMGSLDKTVVSVREVFKQRSSQMRIASFCFTIIRPETFFRQEKIVP